MKNNRSRPLLFLALMITMIAFLTVSCVSTTAVDGTVATRVDQEAVNPWMILARDLFAKPAQLAPLIVPGK